MRFVIGIDLGTTNSACAYVDTDRLADRPRPRSFEVPQLIRPGEIGAEDTLPSFLYFPTPEEQADPRYRLPWQDRAGGIVGALAREHGAIVPTRLVSSAKSWLSHPAIDRTAPVLPWGVPEDEPHCSPVEASARYLIHLREAWDQGPGLETGSRFADQDIILTVPASFDAEARELTVEAAGRAGLAHVTLLEEPLAAFYAWASEETRPLASVLAGREHVLVCDVGGGTTDFTLIRVRFEGGDIGFERTAIGEHLLLGGDNLDLAIARQVLETLGQPRLTLGQRYALVRQASAAKELVLSGAPDARIHVAGAGGRLVGGALDTRVSRDEVLSLLTRGFLPRVDAGDQPALERRPGLRELGLPYASDPAITRHLAAFLAQAAQAERERGAPREAGATDGPASLVRPDAVLFNGGFFAPAVTRERLLNALASWFARDDPGWQPMVLTTSRPAIAIALGAASFGMARRGVGLRVTGGSPRAYYIGLQKDTETPPADAEGRTAHAVCILPRGTEEGTTIDLSERRFAVMTNQPVSFTLYSTLTGRHEAGEIAALDLDRVHHHAPLVSILRFGKRTRHVELPVHLTARFTEVGTLDLRCASRETEHTWRLQFQLRGQAAAGPAPEGDEAETVVAPEAIDAASRAIRQVFDGGEPLADPSLVERLTGQIEAALGYGKHAWPLSAIRVLCDVLIAVAEGRRRGPRFEARWLNLFGFCLRPGFGATRDEWRVAQARAVYLQGLVFPQDQQCQVEWVILLQRVAAGFTAGQQRELYQRQQTLLGIGGRRPARRVNPQVERETWRLLANLEHLPASTRTTLGEDVIRRITRPRDQSALLWSLGRLGARTPFYGPLNAVVPPEQAGAWAARLLELRELTPEAAEALVQLCAKTGDPARDVDDDLRQRVIERLVAAGIGEGLERLRRPVPAARADALRLFGETLPEGLRLQQY